MKSLCAASFLLAFVSATASAGDKPAVILKHEGWVAAVAFAPDGKTLASAGADNVVRLWEVGTWKAKGVLKGHTDCVCFVAYSAECKAWITTSYDRTVKLWGGENSELHTSQIQKGIILSAPLAVTAFPALVIIGGGVDGEVRVLDFPADEKPFIRHKSWVNSIVIAKDWLASGSSDGTVGLTAGKKKPIFLEGGAGEVRCVAFSPDGKLLAAGNRYHTVRVWDVASKKEIKTLAGHTSDVWAIAFSPDGKTLAAADTDWKKPSKVKLWDTATWQERGALDVAGEILAIAYSPKGDWLAVGSWDRTVRVFAIK